MMLTLELLAAAVAILLMQYRPKTRVQRRNQHRKSAKHIRQRTQNQRFASSRREFRLLDIGMLLTEVSTRLRSGAMIESAWAQTLKHYGLLSASFNSVQAHGNFIGAQNAIHRRKYQDLDETKSDALPQRVLDDDGVPRVLRKIWQAGKLERLRLGIPSHVIEALPAAFAVCRLGYCAGAPMAEVLDACARGVTEASEARAARKTALAGPIASARMLAALPVIGIFFGTAMGVNVLDFLVHHYFGNICLVLGIAFELAGMIYVRLLVLQAMRDER